MAIANGYTVPIPDDAQVGDIVVVGIYGPDVLTPTGWTILAHHGFASLFSHVVAAGDPGTYVTFVFRTPRWCGAFVYVVRGSTGATGTIVTSSTAVSTLNFTVEARAAELVLAGCFSHLSQAFATSNLVSAPSRHIANLHACGTGTNCPSVIAFQAAPHQAISFTGAKISSLAAWQLHFSGTTPFVYYVASTTQGNIPAASPA